MKILAVSDIEEAVLYEETKRAKIGKIDLLISCGDLKESYLSYLSTVYGAPLFYVRGNHDRAIGKAEWQNIYDESAKEEKILYTGLGQDLHRRLIRYHGMRLMGFEGSPTYSGDAVEYSEREMSWYVRMASFKSGILGQPDIIVTHAPPQGIHEGSDYAHRGFAAFTSAISRLKPRFFLHGHTHLNYERGLPRYTVVGETTVINVFGYYLFEI